MQELEMRRNMTLQKGGKDGKAKGKGAAGQNLGKGNVDGPPGFEHRDPQVGILGADTSPAPPRRNFC